MSNSNDPLARLRADRDAALHAEAVYARAVADRRQYLHAVGYRLALHHLTWRQVDQLRRARETMRFIDAGNSVRLDGLGLDRILGKGLPEDPAPQDYAEWVAFLEGVKDAAQAVEAAG